MVGLFLGLPCFNLVVIFNALFQRVSFPSIGLFIFPKIIPIVLLLLAQILTRAPHRQYRHSRH